MKKINLRDYYPYYTQDMIVEVPDEVALLEWIGRMNNVQVCAKEIVDAELIFV